MQRRKLHLLRRWRLQRYVFVGLQKPVDQRNVPDHRIVSDLHVQHSQRLSSSRFREHIATFGEHSEDIERKEFGGDGFDMAVDEIADLEGRLATTDLASFTAPTIRPS